jgi:hypothetical protein
MADASMVKTAPRAEKGSPTGVPLWGVLSWASMGAQAGLQQGGDIEYVPELQWPNSVWTYGQMRNDSQVDGLARGSMLPITRWDWGLDPNNADPAVVRELMRVTSACRLAERERRHLAIDRASRSRATRAASTSTST